MRDQEGRRLIRAFLPGLFFCIAIAAIQGVQEIWGLNFVKYGMFPRSFNGFIGVVTMPLLHGGWGHVTSNAQALLLLSFILFYRHGKYAWEITAWLWIINGVWTWAIGRENYHIGASGLVYGLTFFLFVGGVMRRDPAGMAIATLVGVFLGASFWGIFPLFKGVSWEGHLTGALAGGLMAIMYNRGKRYETPDPWPGEEDVPNVYPAPEESYWARKGNMLRDLLETRDERKKRIQREKEIEEYIKNKHKNSGKDKGEQSSPKVIVEYNISPKKNDDNTKP